MGDYIKYKSNLKEKADSIKVDIISAASKSVPKHIKKANRRQWLYDRLQLELIEDNSISFDIIVYASIITVDRRLVEELNEKFHAEFNNISVEVM